MSTQDCADLSLHWLPAAGDFDPALALARGPGVGDSDSDLLGMLTSLANRRIDFVQTRRLDRLLAEAAGRLAPQLPRLRLAVLGSSTLDHLVPGIRVGALRRGLFVEVYLSPYGQWRQQILDPASELYAFRPDVVMLSLDRTAILPDLPLDTSAEDVETSISAAIDELAGLWRKVGETARAVVLQQTPWAAEDSVFGHLDRMVAASPAAIAAELDRRLAMAAAAEGAKILDLRTASGGIGMHRIADPALWYHAKQAVSPAAAPWVGDHVARVLAAIRGLSKKVLVLDLDNTLWGGTIGDDGVDGIVLGQGSGAGEAYSAFQNYARRLAARGVLLAVSSKNDRAVAEAAFAEHPEMVLRFDDFAAFEADWNDKPSAIRRIAEDLDLGLDSMVFFDDNPVERALMRRTLPMVAVPEIPEAPELYVRCLSDAGYFETVSFTADDLRRNAQYAGNRERRRLQAGATDIEGFLRELEMTLTVGPFRPADLARITQLINKTNQFNLTTRRYTEAEVRAMVDDPAVLTFAARLADRFGDNGLTSVVIGRLTQNGAAPAMELDSWLMSCRVLGRRVEHAILNVVAAEAREAGADTLIGRYRPTPKNGMVEQFYPGLGFSPLPTNAGGGETAWTLPLAGARLPTTEHLTLIRDR